MSDLLIYMFKIILYFFMIFVIYFIVKKKYNLNKKLSSGIKILISSMITCYSAISTAYPFVMDKAIYALKFSSDIYSEQVFNDSLGLWIIEKILHIFTYNPSVLFLLTTFIFSYIILTAYNRAKDAKPITLLLLLTSEYFIFSFYQIKQCVATAFVTLGLVEYFNKNKKLGFLCFVIAIIFHESAIIIFPIIFLLRGTSKKILRILEYIIFLVCIIFFNQISYLVIKFIVFLVPSMGNQLSLYINNGNVIIDSNFMTILKGLPFYLITFFALLQRKNISKQDNYDKYLILSCFNCVTIMLSGYMYWMFRIGIYFYFSNFVLATIVYENFKLKQNKKIYIFTLMLILIILLLKLLIQYYFKYGGI